MAKNKGKKYLFEVLFGGKVSPSLNASIGKVNAQFNTIQGFAKKAVAGIGAAFAAVKIKDFVGDSINTYKDYEKSLAQTAATASIQRGTKDFELLDKAAMDAGKATSKTAAEAADALGYMSLAGWNVKQSTSALMPVLRLSEATQADLATTSNLVTGSMASMGIAMDSEGKNISRYLDVVIAMNNKSKQSAAEAMEAFTGVGGTLKRWNTPIEESAAVLGVLANRDIIGSEAGNALSSIMINITKESGESSKAMEALGLSAYDSQGKFKGIIPVFSELNEKINALGDDDKLKDNYLAMIGGKTQVDTLNSILAGFNTFTEDGSTEIEHLVAEFKESDNALNNMAETIGGTMSMKFDILSSAIDYFKITFIRHFESFITPAIGNAAEKISLFTDKIDAGLTNIKRVSGAFLSLMGMDTSSLGFNFGDGGAKLAIKEITGLDTSHIEALTGIFTSVKNNIVSVAGAVKSVLATSLDGAKKGISGIASFLLDTITNTDFISFAKGIGNSFSSIIGNGISVAATVFDTLKGAATTLIPHIEKLLPIIGTIALNMSSILSSVIKGIGNTIIKIAPIALNTFKTILPVVSGIARFILSSISLVIKGIKLITPIVSSIFGFARDSVLWFVNGLLKIPSIIVNTIHFVGSTLISLPENIKSIFSSMSTAISTKVTEITTNVKTGFTNMKHAVISKALEIWTGVKTAFLNMKNSVISTVTEVWTNVKTTFGNLKDSVITKATELWEGVKSVFGNIRDSIAGAFTGAVNTAIGGLNTLINKVNSVHINIPDWIPGVGGKEIGLNIPQVPTLSSNVPALASGGIVTKPTLAMIGEGNEKEAVFPLSKLEEFLSNYGSESTNNTGMVFQIEYKPQIIIQGNGNKEEIQQEVEKGAAKAQADFETQMNQWLKAQKRRGFA